MAKKERLLIPKVNFFDGQKITEAELDTEQVRSQTVVSDMVIDFHGSGVVRQTPFESRILLDTRYPGLYSSDTNPSKSDIESGEYDGHGINLDRQPLDSTRGNRIELEVVDVAINGRIKPKFMIIGRSFDGVDEEGLLTIEFIEFETNCKKVSQHYFREIISILCNNFSGGTGKTELSASVDSENLITDSSGYLIIREAEPLSVYSATKTIFQTESPNINLRDFITSDTSLSIEDEISIAIGAANNIADAYIEIDGKEQVEFEKDGNTAISYGQKFLAKTNNIQRVDVLLAVSRDDEQPDGQEYDWSGDLVVSFYELATDTDCVSSAVPDNLIDFDPEITPLMEVSFGQDDLEVLGFSLNATPQRVSFNFSGTLLADPNMDLSIEKNKYYAFMISRRGDNRIGTISLSKGYDTATQKSELGVPLSKVESFGKRTTKFVEFDPNTKRYINDSTSSLWFELFSDAVEVIDGTAYSDTGVAVTIPKTELFVGKHEISYFENNISLKTVAEGAENYVILSHIEKFTVPTQHPRTGNLVFSRILDAGSASIVTQSELDDLISDDIPLILSKVTDKNVREAQPITGSLTKPGLIATDKIYIHSPSSSLLNANLINRIIVPDTNCECTAQYRIIKTECLSVLAGDIDGDGAITSADIEELLGLVGHTINSSVTEKEILGGSLDVIDFIKADLNEDNTIDGTDIELLEDALDGYVNFTAPETIKFLVLTLENILSSTDYPEIFSDTTESGVTTASEDSIEFETTQAKALIIRPGDSIEIESGSTDAGTYIIATKTIADNGTSVTVTVTDADGEAVIFVGDTDFNVTIISGTAVNTYADNPNLVQIPFVTSDYEITFIESAFEGRFVETCDLRRFVGTSFIEEQSSTCLCETETCLTPDICSPQYKTQTYIPGDVYIPNGSILSAPGVPHHGDIEYVNINITMPPGSINDCSIDLYNTFIKAESGSCLTAAGYTAMKYSDGTLVGCEDDGSDTDISKDRVRISQAIASLHVDAFVDGYSEDGYVESETSPTTTEEAISEEFIDLTYTSFDEWTDDASNSTSITNISHESGTNEAAIFDLLTTADSSVKFGRLNSPAEAQDFTGDFIVEFKSARTVWPTTLTTGTVSAFSTFTVVNDDGSGAVLKLGWRYTGTSDTKMFYSGEITDSSSALISTFDYEIDAPDSVGTDVLFRLRRVNDVITAMYIVPDEISELSAITFGQYIRIGENPDVQPGDGPVSMSFEISQVNSPDVGLAYFVRLSRVIIFYDYVSDSDETTISIGRDLTTNESKRAILTFPIEITKTTTLISATLKLVAKTTGTFTDTFNIIPLEILNANNLSAINNYPQKQDVSLIKSFIPSEIVTDTNIEIDVTSLIASLIGISSHLPGYHKAFVIESDITADSEFDISSEATLELVYEESTTGVIFKVGSKLDRSTGIATFNTKNILYNAANEVDRTVLSFGVFLKKAGFKNDDLQIGISDLNRLGLGTCSDQDVVDLDDDCYFIAGSSSTGVFVEGPFNCITGESSAAEVAEAAAEEEAEEEEEAAAIVAETSRFFYSLSEYPPAALSGADTTAEALMGTPEVPEATFTLEAGDTFKFKFVAQRGNDGTTGDPLELQFRLGSGVVLLGSNINPDTGDMILYELEGSVITAGATGLVYFESKSLIASSPSTTAPTTRIGGLVPDLTIEIQPDIYWNFGSGADPLSTVTALFAYIEIKHRTV